MGKQFEELAGNKNLKVMYDEQLQFILMRKSSV